MRDALLRMVRAGMKTKKMLDAFVQVELDSNALFEIWGDILEAVYNVVGEHTPTFEESVTYTAMNAPILTDERRVEMLYAEWRKNHPEQPKAYIIEPEEVRKMVRKNGGYMTPEGDWS